MIDLKPYMAKILQKSRLDDIIIGVIVMNNDNLKQKKIMLKPFYQKPIYYGVFLLVIIVYTISINYTSIDPSALLDINKIGGIVSELLKPNIFEKEKIIQDVSIPFSYIEYNRLKADTNTSLEYTKSEYIKLDKYSANKGDTITVSGGKWKPNAKARLLWITSQDSILKKEDSLISKSNESKQLLLKDLITSDTGEFNEEIRIPEIAGRINQIKFELDSNEDMAFF